MRRRTSRPARRAVFLLVVLVAAGVVAALVAPPMGGRDGDAGAQTIPFAVGIVANTLDGGPRTEQTIARAVGASWLREEVRWWEIQPRRGDLRWKRLDKVFIGAAHRRLRVLPVVYGTPSWAGRDTLALPDDGEAWAAFVTTVVARYGPGGRFWDLHPRLDDRLAPRTYELWNEPYLEAYSTGGVDPGRYARLVRRAAEAAREVDPAARFLVAADTTYEDRAGAERDWVAGMYAAEPELSRFFDGIAVHPYTFGPPAGRRLPRREQFLRIDDVRRAFDERGARDKRLWITEIGWSTCALRPDCVSERRQARYVRQLFRLLARRRDDGIAAVFLYHLRDTRTPEPRNRERYYGLLRHDGSRKPAWHGVRELTRRRP